MSDVYLVEDHALVRDGLQLLLERAGHRVVGGSDNPTEAIADISRMKPELVLLDIYLDDRSGFEVLEKLQQLGLPSRAIVITMSEQNRHVTEALRLGAMGYVLKDSASLELLDALKTVATGRRYLCKRSAEMAVDGFVNAPNLLNSLSPREQQIIHMVVRGHTSAAIGEQLFLSPKTVESYRSRIMGKLQVADVPALVRLAIREGIIRADE